MGKRYGVYKSQVEDFAAGCYLIDTGKLPHPPKNVKIRHWIREHCNEEEIQNAWKAYKAMPDELKEPLILRVMNWLD